jgi:hypothetical protein
VRWPRSRGSARPRRSAGPASTFAWRRRYAGGTSTSSPTTADALVLIAFLGSVFSPFYAAARRRGPTDPLAHAALHVALYRRGEALWSLTERPRSQVQQSGEDRLVIGGSELAWEGGALVVRFEETTAPFWASLWRGAAHRREVRLGRRSARQGDRARRGARTAGGRRRRRRAPR